MLAIYARTSKENAYDTRESPIEQQIQAGIEFAKTHNLQYKIYQDKGISGYKTPEDFEKDPFSLRPDFSRLIDDIKKPYQTKKKTKDGKKQIIPSYKGDIIDVVYVWENTRLARNTQIATYIYKIFQDYGVKVYNKDGEVNYTNSTDKLMLTILNAIGEYERDLIVARTTRGFYDAVDKGKRAHAKFYGYKKLGRDKDKNYLWEKNPSELDEIRFAYKEYLAGKSLRQIALTLWAGEDTPKSNLHRTSKLARFLAHAEYTGYNLKMSGLEVLHKFENFEIPDLHLLKDPQYWVESKPYPEKLISIEDWITIREKLNLNKVAREKNNKEFRSADKSISTGLIKCGLCGMAYFYYHFRQTYKGNIKDYEYYYHHKSLNNKICENHPKSLNISNTDAIFEAWFIFWVLIFDRSEELTNEQLEKMAIEKKSIKEKIKNINKEIKETQTREDNYNRALSDKRISTEQILTISSFIAECINQIQDLTLQRLDQEAQLQKIEVETEKAENDKIFNSMHNLIDAYRSGSTEDKRNLLIKVLGSDGRAFQTLGKINIIKNNIECGFFITKNYAGYGEKISNYFTEKPEELKKIVFEIKQKKLEKDYQQRADIPFLWHKKIEFVDCSITLTKVAETENELEQYSGFNVFFDIKN